VGSIERIIHVVSSETNFELKRKVSKAVPDEIAASQPHAHARARVMDLPAEGIEGVSSSKADDVALTWHQDFQSRVFNFQLRFLGLTVRAWTTSQETRTAPRRSIQAGLRNITLCCSRYRRLIAQSFTVLPQPMARRRRSGLLRVPRPPTLASGSLPTVQRTQRRRIAVPCGSRGYLRFWIRSQDRIQPSTFGFRNSESSESYHVWWPLAGPLGRSLANFGSYRTLGSSHRDAASFAPSRRDPTCRQSYHFPHQPTCFCSPNPDGRNVEVSTKSPWCRIGRLDCDLPIKRPAAPVPPSHEQLRETPPKATCA
jgi:hypothetical protein